MLSMKIYPVLREQSFNLIANTVETQGIIVIIKLGSTKKSSDNGKEVTPVPIPNTEVKLFSADGSWGFPPVRVGRR